MRPTVLFFKSHVGAYLRGGKLVQGYQGRNARAVAMPGQRSLFDADEHGEVPPARSAYREPEQNEPSIAPATDQKILFMKPSGSSNLSNNEPVANKQELKMEAKTVVQLTAELKAAEAVMAAELSEARKFKQSDRVMNEGGGGYSRSEDLSEAAYSRNMPKIKAAKQALFEAIWTPEVTSTRRAAWNAEAATMRTTTQVLKLQEKLGFTGAELKSAIALNEGK